MKRALGVFGIAVLAAVSVGCSGGGGGPTKAEFVRQANAVCRDGAKRVSLLRIPGRADVASMPQAAASVVVVQRKSLESLRALKPPKADRTQITKWIALVDQTIDQAEISAEAQRDGDIARALAANINGAALDTRADEMARHYGLVTCVQATTAPPTSTTTTTKAGA